MTEPAALKCVIMFAWIGRHLVVGIAIISFGLRPSLYYSFCDVFTPTPGLFFVSFFLAGCFFFAGSPLSWFRNLWPLDRYSWLPETFRIRVGFSLIAGLASHHDIVARVGTAFRSRDNMIDGRSVSIWHSVCAWHVGFASAVSAFSVLKFPEGFESAHKILSAFSQSP